MNNVNLYCQFFYAAFNIPIALWENDLCTASFGLPNGVGENERTFRALLQQADNPPVVLLAHDQGMYGLLQSGENSYLMIGPIFAIRPDEKTFRLYCHDHAIVPEKRPEVLSVLQAIPLYSYYHFLNLIIYLEYTVNGRQLSMEKHFQYDPTAYQDEIDSIEVHTGYMKRDNEEIHNTYQLEMQILDYIREGSPQQLRNFLLQIAQESQLTVGQVGDTQLRQFKNVFIAFVAIVGKQAAIPGGMDVEETYRLIDTYSIECERLTSVQDVTKLQYGMVMDFAQRTEAARLDACLSPEMRKVISYIETHLNQQIQINDLCKELQCSRATIVRLFHNELQEPFSIFVRKARIREAQRLLKYTNHSISEICSYLAFSSQSYFQNIFRKETGKTPLQYKREISNR